MNMPFSIAVRCMKDEVNTASTIVYNLKSKTVQFERCEMCFLICDYENNISGTESQLASYFRKFFSEMFPEMRIEIYNH